jgi:hypothetical protein
MTSITIQLSPEVERRLRAVASHSGKSIETYLEELAVQLAEEGGAQDSAGNSTAILNANAEDWIASWRTWVHSHPSRAVLADDSRDSIYEGQGE